MTTTSRLRQAFFLKNAAFILALFAGFTGYVWILGKNAAPEQAVNNNKRSSTPITTSKEALDSSNWYNAVTKKVAEAEYTIQYQAQNKTYESPNRAHNLRITYRPGQVSMITRKDSLKKENWKLDLHTTSIRFDEKRQYYPIQNPDITTKGDTIEFRHGDLFTEQYINNSEGLRQNFIVHHAPGNNNQKLCIQMQVSGQLHAMQVHKTEVHFGQVRKDGNWDNKIVYKDLKAWDVNGKTLESEMKLEGNELCLLVNTQSATFPITVDPISTTVNAQLECNQANALFGFSVASAGDVNSDGYSDVIIGALSYDNGETDEGRAYVFHGSASGVSTSPTTIVESNQTGASLGNSVASAGDVNGDGYSDVIVTGYGYTNGQASEGAAYVYLGSASGISTTPQIILESNQANAGLMMAMSAGDVNGDGYSDVIVGVNTYDNGQTDEGAALIYHGSASGVTSTVQTQLESNQASSCFGLAVAGAGDVDGDGYSDVIVGARLYDNGQSDEGAAFIYNGSSTGITTTIQTQLEVNQVSADLGYSVNTAGDVNGDGYSDVIVSADLYDNGESNEGAVFIFPGSSSGITTTIQTQLELNLAGNTIGNSVACAGDVNGDGYSDVIIGVRYYANGQADEGGAFVFHGSSTGITTTIQTQLELNQASAQFGVSVASAGDVNGDGYSDIIVGAYVYDNGQTDEGGAFVYQGGTSGINSAIDVQLEVNQASARFGICVASAGDVNGDGYSDVIVGSDSYDNGQTDEGAVFVFHGSSSGLSTSYTTMLESNQASAFMGYVISSAGDVNGDGYSDIIVGSDSYDNGQTGEGAAFVYHGSASGITTTIQTQLESNQASARMGYSVASAGDVNRDGYSDVIVGAPYYDNGQTNEGAVFVFHGSASGITTTIQAQLERNQASAYLGFAVASAGDVNGDGYGDVMASAYLYDNGQTDEGAVFIYHGSASGVTTTVQTQLESNQASANMGAWGSIACAGDVNGDGYSDVIIGAYLYDNGQTDEGAAFVYHGSASGITTTVQQQLEYNQASAYFGFAVASAGDVNGDGYSDIIVGAYAYDNGQTDEGAAFIYHGSASGITTTVQQQLESNQASANLGYSASYAGDVNGDGYSDVIVGVRKYDNGQTDEGGVFVYYGNAKTGKRGNLRLYNSNLTSIIGQSNYSSSTFGIGLYSKSFLGRAKGKLVWEVKKQGVPFSSGVTITNSVSSTSQQAGYTDLGTAGTELKNLVTKTGTAHKVRARVAYSMTTAITGQKYGPWIYVSDLQGGRFGMTSSPLPIELLSFEARAQDTKVLLSWETATETNNHFFTIEKSRNGREWIPVDIVNGAGNSNVILSYNLTDEYPYSGTSYYRLKQTDFDGKSSCSNTIFVEFMQQTAVKLFPNPVADELTVVLNNPQSEAIVDIFDPKGQKVLSYTSIPFNPSFNIPVAFLPPGLYMIGIKASANPEYFFTSKFVKAP